MGILARSLANGHLNSTYLSIVLEPLGCNLGDCIVLLLLTLGDASKILRNAFAHRSEELSVDVLLEGGRLFYKRKV